MTKESSASSVRFYQQIKIRHGRFQYMYTAKFAGAKMSEYSGNLVNPLYRVGFASPLTLDGVCFIQT